MAPKVSVSAAGCSSFARPKSSTFTWPLLFTRMLAGFTSRWTMPAACAAASAPLAWTAWSSTWAIGIGDSAITLSRARPSTNSMAMKVTPSAESMS